MGDYKVCNITSYLIGRKDPKSGFYFTLWYTGPLPNKPKGWTILKKERI